MKQYKEHLQLILNKGTVKPAARENMPGTISLFGHQWRHDLQDGFPLLTTKKVWWKGVIIELLWFLRGDTNVKYLNDNGVDFWNEDAYAYYVKLCKNQHIKNPLGFKLFSSIIKNEDNVESLKDQSIKNSTLIPHIRNVIPKNYILGDTGKQYGVLWRNWEHTTTTEIEGDEYIDKLRGIKETLISHRRGSVDQFKELVDGLKSNPMGRRHIITAWNPATLDDMALNACHVLAQFNCRPIDLRKRKDICEGTSRIDWSEIEDPILYLDERNVPKYYLDCQMYQRSADMFLGVPLNIASYALLTHILCEICNMVPGEMIYSYGDSHIYENHMDQVKEQLSRECKPLPTLKIFKKHPDHGTLPDHIEKYLTGRYDLNEFIQELSVSDFQLVNYDPHPAIKGELSTGISK